MFADNSCEMYLISLVVAKVVHVLHFEVISDKCNLKMNVQVSDTFFTKSNQIKTTAIIAF
jgi:hypothetical protein